MRINRFVFKRYAISGLLLISLILIVLINIKNYKPKILSEDSSEPLYVFIDLGANKGDSIYNFVGLTQQALGGNLNNPIFPQSFKKEKWIIYGFEANGFFDEQLDQMRQQVVKMGHTVHLYKSTAAWTYDGTIDFYLDTVNAKKDFWGSSLNKKHVC